MKIVKEFKEFAMRGNVIDLAVGVVIGGAFGKIVTSLVNDVIMPPIGKILGGVDFKDLKIWLADVSDIPVTERAEIPAIAYGQFINVLIDFIIIAFCIFMLVKVINIIRRTDKKEPEKPSAPTEKECPYCLSQVPVKATRCKHCTSHLDEVQHAG